MKVLRLSSVNKQFFNLFKEKKNTVFNFVMIRIRNVLNTPCLSYTSSIWGGLSDETAKTEVSCLNQVWHDNQSASKEQWSFLQPFTEK